jgi:hypothetical protein
MAKNKNTEITDKQSSIKHYMQNTLWLKNIIDAHGNILDLERFRAEVDLAISNCELRMAQNSTVDGVVKDRELHAVLVGEQEYLESLAKHTKNFYPLNEHPIVSHKDLPKARKMGFINRARVSGAIIHERIKDFLSR